MRASQEFKKSSVFRVGDFENDNARTERFTGGGFGEEKWRGEASSLLDILTWGKWQWAVHSSLGNCRKRRHLKHRKRFSQISNKKPLEKRGKRFFTVSRFFLLHFECPIFAQPLIFLVQRMTDFKEVRQYHRTWWKCGSSLQKTLCNHKFC